MGNLKVRKGVKANLPDEGLVEENTLYFCTDVGEVYFGIDANTLMLLTDNVLAKAPNGSVVNVNNPYNNTKATGANAFLMARYAGESAGNDIVIFAVNGNAVINGDKSAIIAGNGTIPQGTQNVVIIANNSSGYVNIPSGLYNILIAAGYSADIDEANTLYVQRIKTQYGDVISGEKALFHSNLEANGDISTSYGQSQGLTFNSIVGSVAGMQTAIQQLAEAIGNINLPNKSSNLILSQNTFLDLGTITANKTLVLPTIPSGTAPEFNGQFKTDSSHKVTFPSSVTMVGNVTQEANSTYQFSICNGYGIIVKVA